ncbi:UDP-glucuronate 4-epimerase [Microbacterium halimionae]|uniref:UDP-glucuronate 4-epimerase n=1 Tax=Microbacterium halimionae TaxID=1526413 RepID=A0A7W3JPT7_9MICO|nr:NAD-dependent epimerase/dehydratase family protein [Microbacterium halimionae]MBA8816800.1 UDP-glucuronate 4-epimerase [Microbacterium halimionae]NII94904.1 UDP-glucuronate 4-epimerase [Microbacterium halimionae]
MKYFVTGVAGFIGFHLARVLLDAGHEVRGFDALTPYYDPSLKVARLARLEGSSSFSFVQSMLEDRDALDRSIDEFEPEIIVHLAAQAGVRYSIDHPDTYVQSNLVGTFNILEAARRVKPRHLLFASTSSVYGGNEKTPFSEVDSSHQPVSLYAATKKAGEVMSHSYSHLFDIPTTCFRFFTVYGPWGRPDMALFKFVDRIERAEPIEVYGNGEMSRDFTYIEDLVHAIKLLADVVPSKGAPAGGSSSIDSLSTVAPWRVVNIAGGRPVGLMAFVEAVERSLGREAVKIMLPMQPGDVRTTSADPRLLKMLTGYEPSTPVGEGVARFVEWYREYRRAG